MIGLHRYILTVCFACLLPVTALFAEAPVVDESENFASLDQTAPAPSAIADNQDTAPFDESAPALARESGPSDTDNANSSAMLEKLQGLQQDIQELRGQLEVQAHDLKMLQQQQLSFYKDLDARIRNEPQKNTTAANNTATDLQLGASAPNSQPTNLAVLPTTAPRGNPADEQISYLAAYDLIKKKQFDSALLAMQTFTNKYPQGGYTANAQYWLGELYMVKKDYPQAIEHFNIVLQQFPASSKAAASLLKLGFAFADSGNTTEARTKLQQVIKAYPDTATAHLASNKLASLQS